MGSRFHAVLYETSKETAQAAWDEIESRLVAIDESLSDWRDDSEVARLRQTPKYEPFTASQRLTDALSRALTWARATDGVFDPTVGPLTRLWRESRRTGTLPQAEELAQARRSVGYQHVALNAVERQITPLVDGLSLDFGAIGKGLALAEAREVLRDRGIEVFLLVFGGDVLAGGDAGALWTTSLPNGENARIANTSIMASGDANQYVVIDGVRYSHIVDPRTGLGATEPGDAVVRCADPIVADFLATTLCLISTAEMKPLLDQFKAKAIVRRGAHEVYRNW